MKEYAELIELWQQLNDERHRILGKIVSYKLQLHSTGSIEIGIYYGDEHTRWFASPEIATAEIKTWLEN